MIRYGEKKYFIEDISLGASIIRGKRISYFRWKSSLEKFIISLGVMASPSA
jgi:hypothetical protein